MYKKNKIITIFGGSGFVGGFIVKELLQSGAYIRIASLDPEKAEQLMPLGKVGQIYFQATDVNDIDSIRRAVTDSDVVINLVADGFCSVNPSIAVNIAKVSLEQNVKQLIHFSALGVNRSYESKYAQRKYQAEKDVQKIFPEVIVIRPGIVFGPGDSFFSKFASLASKLKILPVIGDGYTKFQLVYVDDVAKAVAKIVNHQELYKGKIFELACEEAHSFNEIMRFVCKAVNIKAKLVHIPYLLAKFIAYMAEFMPRPFLTRDQIRLLKYHNTIHKEDKLLYLSSLNIKPRTMEEVVPSYLKLYRRD